MDNEKEPKIKESVAHGVRAEIPGDYADVLDIKFEDAVWEDAMGSVHRGFEVLRLVMDYSFDKSDGVPSMLEKPVKLQVFFTREDLKQVSRLKIAYWKENEWRIFDKDHDLKRVPIQDGIWAGYFEVSITNLDDPSIALGR